jgi:S1-C subfamily serine protease
MLIVVGVAPASAGAAAGLLPGDLLLKAQEQEVGTADELAAAVEGRRSATVTLWRNGGESVAILGGLERRADR